MADCLHLEQPWAGLSAEQKLAFAKNAALAPPSCENQAGHLLVLAWLAHDNNDDFKALAFAERALLFEPDSPSVKLDYAFLLAWSDQYELALALLNQVISRTDIPLGLLQQLVQWQSQLRGLLQLNNQPVGPQGQQGPLANLPGVLSQIRLYAGLGFDTNVNNGLSAETIPLTLPNEVLTLTLDPSERPIQGGLSDWSAIADWTSLAASGDSARWTMGVAASGSSPWGRSAYNTQSLQASLRAFPSLLKEWRLDKFLAHPSGLGLRFGASWFGQRPLVQAAGAEVSWPLSNNALFAGCQPSELGLALDARRYPENPAFSHTLAQLSWGAGCLLGETDLRWLGYATHEEPLNDRPGGQVRRLGFQLGSKTPWSWGSLSATMQLEWSRDAKSYSPLLKSGAKRRSALVSFSLVARKPLSPKLHWISRAQYRTQSSNLPLFSNNGLFVGTGLEATFR